MVCFLCFVAFSCLQASQQVTYHLNSPHVEFILKHYVYYFRLHDELAIRDSCFRICNTKPFDKTSALQSLLAFQLEPLPSALQVEGHVEDAKAKGAKVLIGGARPSLEGKISGGYFFEPTVIGDASVDMKIFKEETFGPAIPCFRFKADAEAVKLANDTEYGLAAYFYTKVGVGEKLAAVF